MAKHKVDPLDAKDVSFMCPECWGQGRIYLPFYYDDEEGKECEECHGTGSLMAQEEPHHRKTPYVEAWHMG